MNSPYRLNGLFSDWPGSLVLFGLRYAGLLRSTEAGQHRRMVAGSHLALDEAGGRPRCQRVAHEHIVEPPPDVPLSQVAPGRPPGEETVVVRVEGATEVHHAAAEDSLDQRALLGKLPNRPGLALFRMYIKIRSRYVHIPAQHELACLPRNFRLE